MSTAIESPCTVEEQPQPRRLGDDRLLGIPEVASLMGVHKTTASVIMKETGHAIQLHHRIYILESNLMDFLRQLEGRHAS